MTETIEAPKAYRMSILRSKVSAGMTMTLPPRPSREPSPPATTEMAKVMSMN